jgi:hypothetical protein
VSALTTYLRDHHAAGCAGSQLARRLASRVTDGSPLRGVAAEIEDDLITLEELMREVGVGPSRAKDALARVAEQLSRVKQSTPFDSTSSATDLMDSETLVVGITGKRALWISLREADAVSDRERLEALIERATAQLEIVEEFRRVAAREVIVRDRSRACR